MALTKKQRDVVRSLELGFERVTGVYVGRYHHNGATYRNELFKEHRTKNIGVGRCIYARIIDENNNLRTNISLSRYNNDASPSRKPNGPMREMNLRFRDDRTDVPRMRISIDGYNTNLSCLVEDLTRTREFAKKVESISRVGKYSEESILNALESCFLQNKRMVRSPENNITYTAKFKDTYSGMHLTVPPGRTLPSTQYLDLRRVASTAKHAANDLVAAMLNKY